MNETNTTIPQEMRMFLEGILEEANVLTLDHEGKEEMLKQLYVRLDTFLVGKVIDNLPEEQLEAYMTLDTAGTDPQKVQAFLQEHIPHVDEVFAIAFDEFRQLYLATTQEARIDEAIDAALTPATAHSLESIANGSVLSHYEQK